MEVLKRIANRETPRPGQEWLLSVDVAPPIGIVVCDAAPECRMSVFKSIFEFLQFLVELPFFFFARFGMRTAPGPCFVKSSASESKKNPLSFVLCPLSFVLRPLSFFFMFFPVSFFLFFSPSFFFLLFAG